MPVQKHHDVADHLLIGPPRRDAFRTFGPDPFDGEKFLRFFFDDVKNIRAESLHKTPGVDGPDPLHHAGTEILFNAVDRGRGRDFENRSLQLPPVLAIRHPSPQSRRVFPSGDGRSMPHHRHQIPVSPHFEPQHAKPVFRVVVRDALDESRYFRSVLRQGFVDDGRIKVRHDGLAENSYCHSKQSVGLLCGLLGTVEEACRRPVIDQKVRLRAKEPVPVHHQFREVHDLVGSSRTPRQTLRERIDAEVPAQPVNSSISKSCKDCFSFSRLTNSGDFFPHFRCKSEKGLYIMRILSQGTQLPAAVQENLNRAQMRSHHGRVAEWLNVPPWKGGVSNRAPRVRIPPLPPDFL